MLPRHHLRSQQPRCRYCKHIQHDVNIYDNIDLLIFQQFSQFTYHRYIARSRIYPFLSQPVSLNIRMQRIERFFLLFRQTDKADLIGILFLQGISNLYGYTLRSPASCNIA